MEDVPPNPAPATNLPDPMAAVDDVFTHRANTILHVVPPGVLLNDASLDGGPARAVLFRPPIHGEVDLASNGGLSYHPPTNFIGEDSFQYVITSAGRTSPPASVRILVDRRNPEARPERYSIPAGSHFRLNGPGVLANDSSFEGARLSAEWIPVPIDGLELGSDGSIVFSPPTDFVGQVHLAYQPADEFVVGDPIVVTIDVHEGNLPPQAIEEEYALVPGMMELEVDPASGVLVNDLDPDNDSLRAELVSGPHHGKLELRSDGAFVYRPYTGSPGEDSFQYRCVDGLAASEAATVRIRYSNRPPEAEADTFEMEPAETLELPAPGILDNDSDPDGLQPVARLIQGPAHGELSLRPDGGFRYVPDPGFEGEDGFHYVASDGVAESPSTWVRIHVQPESTKAKPEPAFQPEAKTVPTKDPTLPGESRPAATPVYVEHTRRGTFKRWQNDEAPVKPSLWVVRRGSRLSVSVTLTTIGSGVQFPVDTPLLVRCRLVQGDPEKPMGIVLGGSDGATLSVDKSRYRATQTELTADNTLPDRVDLYDRVTLVWEFKEGSGPWHAVGRSHYRIATVLDEPIGRYRQAAVIYGCESGRGATDEAGFIKGLKQRLVDRSRPAKNAHGKVLGYYENWQTQARTSKALLEGGDGQCGAWGQFLVDTLRAQGITKGEFVLVVPTRQGDGFLVNNWSPVPNWPEGSANLITFTTDTPNAHGPVSEHYPPFDNRGYTWGKQPFRDEPGLPGQSTKNPVGAFNNHVVVKYGSEFFDPSYGAVYTSLHQMSTNAIYAFYTPKREKNRITWTVRTNDGAQGTLRLSRLLEFRSEVRSASVGVPQRDPVVVSAARIGSGPMPRVVICLQLIDPTGNAQLKGRDGVLRATTDERGLATFQGVTVTASGEGLQLEAYPENEELELPRIRGTPFNATVPK